MSSKRSEEQRERMGLSLRSRQESSSSTPARPRVAPPRVKPVRITIDLEPDLHRRVKVWATEHDARLADVVRALAGRMLDDEQLALAVLDDIRSNAAMQ
jgi:hypothetical protein